MARDNCWTCRRPSCVCLCDAIRPFFARVNFVILAHPREARSKISTGILAHLSLERSLYIEGYDFSKCPQLDKILEDPEADSFLLFPSQHAHAIADVREKSRRASPKKVNFIVIEATWAQARVMLAKAENLRNLPTVVLDTNHHSRFKIRTQPHPACLSTIEAIAYALIELEEIDAEGSEKFLNPFLTMVERQIEYQKQNLPRYRPRKPKSQNGLILSPTAPK